jgi:hypothetical protein
MPNYITIDSITGQSPYNVYLCDVSFANCIYINTITDLDIPYTFEAPPLYDNTTNIVIRSVDNNGCSTENYVNTKYKACRYSQWNTLFWLTYQYNPSVGPFQSVNDSMSSFNVNGNELLSVYYDFEVTSPVTPILQNGVYNCSTVVDWFNNEVFPTLGLTGYTAQMSFVSYGSLDSESLPYFYIIYPENDTFSFVINNWAGVITYSNSGVTAVNGGYGVFSSDCNINTIINLPTGPQVVE